MNCYDKLDYKPRFSIMVTPTQGFTTTCQVVVLWDALFMHPKADRWERPYRWTRLIFMWLAVFALAGQNPVSGDVRSLNGTIKFDSNFDGTPEAILNSTGFGLGTSTPAANLQVAGNAITSGSMVVGGTSNASGSNLHISGSLGFSVQTVTANTTLSGNSVALVDTSAGNIALTLPTASTVNGRVYTVKKTSNSYTLLLGSVSLIDGLPGIELSSSSSAFPYVQVMSAGNTWRIFSRSTEGSVSSANVYIIVDVSSGNTATSYPVTVANLSNVDLTGAGNSQYKTNKIVLRYIPAGTFTMGSPGDEVGRDATREAQHSVTLTQGFYIGVFEVTQQQFLNVVAGYPAGQSYTNSGRPLNTISYADIRGSGFDWPSSGNAVFAGNFMGLLRSKAGLSFDLPTEAQWEYACRAGTTGALNSGSANVLTTGADVNDSNLQTLGWYDYNANTGAGAGGVTGTREVGAKLPNSWGLFDMHGNVWEWCLDWLYDGNLSPATDPVGPSSGLYHVRRGGGWSDQARYCRSAYRTSYVGPRGNNVGFRLALPAGQ